MSISAHGRSRLCCVCRWSSGFWRAMRPGIHIRAGEKVCIQAMTPMQSGAAVASRKTARIASSVVTTGLGTIRTGMASAVVECAGDLGRVLGHRAERVVPVERLAAGDEPDLSVGQGLHPAPSTAILGAETECSASRPVCAGVWAATGAPSARGREIECMHSCAGMSRRCPSRGTAMVRPCRSGPAGRARRQSTENR